MAIKRPIALMLLIFLSGCIGSGGEEIKDFSNRSTVYGWLDIEEINGNHLYNVTIKQYKPVTKEPYYSAGFEKLKGGYLFYHHGFLPGSYKLNNINLQSCFLFFCGNTYYNYDFGQQGDMATAVINKSSVYYAGSYKMKDEESGWFSPGKFDVTKASNGPSQAEMLTFLIEHAPKDHPVIAERLRKAMPKSK